MVFVSAVIIAVILLYGITRKKWNWARGSQRTSLGIAAVILIVGVVFSFWANYQQIGNLLRKQTTYADLTLGMTMADVRLVKGIPEYLRSGNPFYDIAIGFTPAKGKSNSKIDSFFRWYYANGEQIDINFSPTTKELKSIACEPSRDRRCPLLLGVKDGMTRAQVIEKLGKASDDEIEDGIETLTYDNLGAWFSLENGKITRLGIGDAN